MASFLVPGDSREPRCADPRSGLFCLCERGARVDAGILFGSGRQTVIRSRWCVQGLFSCLKEGAVAEPASFQTSFAYGTVGRLISVVLRNIKVEALQRHGFVCT